MKTIGMVGGISPESTVDYYRLMIAAYREQVLDGSYPLIILNSINLKTLVDLVTANDWVRLTEYMLGEVQRLARAGAEYGLLAANTPHIVFDEVRRLSPIALVSIVEATCEAAKAMGLKRLGLFGTRFTMQGRFYPEVFSRQGIALVVPDPNDQAYIHEKYMNELVNGIFLPGTRAGLLTIVDRMQERDGIEGLILGGTELPLILRDEASHDAAPGRIPFLDTTRIHVRAIVARALS